MAMSDAAAEILRDTLRYAKKRGYSINIRPLPNGKAVLVVKRPISHESIAVAKGREEEMLKYLEYWRDLNVPIQINFDDEPVRWTRACFQRDRKAVSKCHPRLSDSKAEKVWRRYEQPEYYA
jgi:hypothetical protein